MAPLDLNLSDTYFIPGHFHYVMAVSGTFAIFGAIYYLFPKMTGRMYSEVLGWAGFILTFIGINLVFFPMHELGLKGHRLGGAVVSERHGNFFVNRFQATADDLLGLIDFVRQRIRQAFGHELEEEVIVWT